MDRRQRRTCGGVAGVLYAAFHGAAGASEHRVLGTLMGESAAQSRILDEVGWVIGPEAAGALSAIVESAHQSDSGLISSIVGIVVLIVGASGVFGELQYALDTIWGVKPKPSAGSWAWSKIACSRFRW